MRRNYWSCSKFADWLRGTPKLEMGTSEQWSAWRKLAKSHSKFRYWLAEEGLDMLQDFVYWPVDKLYSIKYYIVNRWVDQTHALVAHKKDLPRGQWADVGSRFLPCLMNELVDFVEVETARHHALWMNKEERKKYNPPWPSMGPWNTRSWRSAECGLDHLKWASELRWSENEVGEDSNDLGQLTQQAVAAREIMAIYDWWKNVYPNRPDPYDASGWTKLCEERRTSETDEDEGVLSSLMKDRSPEEAAQRRASLDRLREIEEQYDAEDTEMMIRLIKIRKSLWT